MGRYPGEGNYLQKSRKNFFLSRRCQDMLLELSCSLGVSQTSIIELAVREKYQKDLGEEITPELRRVK